jgi:hypothetical protein
MKKFIAFLIFLSCVLVLAFYWYEWRPTKIRKECQKKANQLRANRDDIILKNFEKGIIGNNTSDFIKSYQTAFEQDYKTCLRECGLEK